MNYSCTLRIIAAVASVVITLALFGGVASLSEPPQAVANAPLSHPSTALAVADAAKLR